MDSDYQPLLGLELDDPAIDDVLRDVGVGILSMSAEGVPYGVPLSFGYDGDDSLYFIFLGATTELRKETYAERSDVASFATFDIDPDGSWRSVIVAGPLDRISIDEWDVAREAMIDNAYQSNLLAERELRENPNVWALEMQERSGRAVGQR
jgi:nitroimidazol reductase NimA-like FMN-containing flavoprotein (pyridoxamine 5'-phosphate oxidase superfamily)